jgi:HAE1 family hydrophobic/amphiphilic exporter-1
MLVDVMCGRNTDMNFARLALMERLAALRGELPHAVGSMQVTDVIPDELRVQQTPLLTYSLSSDQTPEQLRSYIDGLVAPVLMRIPGVSGVKAVGGRVPGVQLQLDDDKLASYGIDVSVVVQDLETRDLQREVGQIPVDGLLHSVAIGASAPALADLSNDVVELNGHRNVRIHDVALVTQMLEPPYSLYRVDRRPAVSLEVYRRIGANALRVAPQVKAEMARLSAGHSGMTMSLDSDESEAIRRAVAWWRHRLLISMLLTAAALAIVFRSLLAPLLVVVAMTLSVAGGIVWLDASGTTLSVVAIAGLSVGVLLVAQVAIDVIAGIQAARRRDLGRARAVRLGARRGLRGLSAGTLLPLLGLLPAVYVAGEARFIYGPFVVALTATMLVGALVVSTLVPVIGAAWPAATGGQPHVHSRPTRPSRLALRHPWYVLGAVGSLVASSGAWLYSQRETPSTAPTIDRAIVSLQLRQSRGADIMSTDAIVRTFEAYIHRLPYAVHTVTRVYPEEGTIDVGFSSEVEHTAIPLAVRDSLLVVANRFSGAQIVVAGRGAAFASEATVSARFAVAVRGYDYSRVRDIARDLGASLRRFPRVRSIDVDATGVWSVPDHATEVVVHLNRRRLAEFGLTVPDVVRRVDLASRGAIMATRTHVGGIEQDVRITLAAHSNPDTLALLQVSLPLPAGGSVPLGAVATINAADTPARIARVNQQYQRLVTYEFRGYTERGQAIRHTLLRSTSVPNGYSLEAVDDAGELLAGGEGLGAVAVMALAAVFMMAAALLESVRQALLVIGSLSCASIGAALGVMAAGMPTRSQLILGLLLLMGIGTPYGIGIIDRLRQRRRWGRDATTDSMSVVQALRDSGSFVLLRGFCIVLGLTPFLLQGRGLDVTPWNIITVPLIGGIATTALLLPVVVSAIAVVSLRRDRALAATADAAS